MMFYERPVSKTLKDLVWFVDLQTVAVASKSHHRSDLGSGAGLDWPPAGQTLTLQLRVATQMIRMLGAANITSHSAWILHFLSQLAFVGSQPVSPWTDMRPLGENVLLGQSSGSQLHTYGLRKHMFGKSRCRMGSKAPFGLQLSYAAFTEVAVGFSTRRYCGWELSGFLDYWQYFCLERTQG